MIEILAGMVTGAAALATKVGTAIAGLATQAGSILTSLPGKIGSTIGSFASNALELISKIIKEMDVEKFINLTQSVSESIHKVADFLDIESETDSVVLGAKAEQAEVKSEDFSNTESYIKYLKDEVELDHRRFEKISEEDKLGCRAVGMSLEVKAIEEKIGDIQISPECIALLAKLHFASAYKIAAGELVSIIKNLKEAGITDLNDVVELLEGKGNSSRIKTGLALETAVEKAGIADPKSAIENVEIVVRSFDEDKL